MRILQLVILLLLSLIQDIEAQPVDPFDTRILVVNDQGLSFGKFWQITDTGGSVSISNTGLRTATGDIGLVSSTFYYSVFTISTESTSAFTITIDQPTVLLSGSNGGSMSLQIGPANPLSPSVISGSPVEVFIGGTLTIGTRTSNPPGNYSGEALITFTINNQ